jgi:hypothetical protein
LFVSIRPLAAAARGVVWVTGQARRRLRPGTPGLQVSPAVPVAGQRHRRRVRSLGRMRTWHGRRRVMCAASTDRRCRRGLGHSGRRVPVRRAGHDRSDDQQHDASDDTPSGAQEYPLSHFETPFIAWRTLAADSDTVCPAIVTGQALAHWMPVYGFLMTDDDIPPYAATGTIDTGPEPRTTAPGPPTSSRSPRLWTPTSRRSKTRKSETSRRSLAPATQPRRELHPGPSSTTPARKWSSLRPGTARRCPSPGSQPTTTAASGTR